MVLSALAAPEASVETRAPGVHAHLEAGVPRLIGDRRSLARCRSASKEEPRPEGADVGAIGAATQVLHDAAVAIERLDRQILGQAATLAELLALGRRECAVARGRGAYACAWRGAADHHAIEHLVRRAAPVIHEQDLRRVAIEAVGPRRSARAEEPLARRLVDLEHDAQVATHDEVRGVARGDCRRLHRVTRAGLPVAAVHDALPVRRLFGAARSTTGK